MLCLCFFDQRVPLKTNIKYDVTMHKKQSGVQSTDKWQFNLNSFQV